MARIGVRVGGVEKELPALSKIELTYLVIRLPLWFVAHCLLRAKRASISMRIQLVSEYGLQLYTYRVYKLIHRTGASWYGSQAPFEKFKPHVGCRNMTFFIASLRYVLWHRGLTIGVPNGMTWRHCSTIWALIMWRIDHLFLTMSSIRRCPNCNVIFPTIDALNGHYKLTSHMPLAYSCEPCQRAFQTLSSLQNVSFIGLIIGIMMLIINPRV